MRSLTADEQVIGAEEHAGAHGRQAGEALLGLDLEPLEVVHLHLLVPGTRMIQGFDDSAT
jgi:hypothetical protein